jgi:hypothetical protein
LSLGTTWMGTEYVAPPGFNSQTVQPVASGCTYYALSPLYICHD